VGIEDLEIPESIVEAINLEEKDPKETNADQVFQHSINENSSTDDNSTCYMIETGN